jgi:hypothetical protein
MTAYKIDGAKFSSLQELEEVMWDLYKDRMPAEDFQKLLEKGVEKAEGA